MKAHSKEDRAKMLEDFKTMTAVEVAKKWNVRPEYIGTLAYRARHAPKEVVIDKPVENPSESSFGFTVSKEPEKPEAEAVTANVFSEEAQQPEALKPSEPEAEKKPEGTRIKAELLFEKVADLEDAAFRQYNLSKLSDTEKSDITESAREVAENRMNFVSKYADIFNFALSVGMPFVTRIPEIIAIRSTYARPKQEMQKTENAGYDTMALFRNYQGQINGEQNAYQKIVDEAIAEQKKKEVPR